MSEEFVMSRWMIVCLLCLILAVPLYAQDDTLTPYDIALQRIQEVNRNRAQELDLGALGLTELPPELWELVHLRALWLDNNRLTTLSPEIGQLTNLQWLALNSNDLTNIPVEIGQLNALQGLNLSTNDLINLPSGIGQLTNLQVLSLANNHFQHLPTQIANFPNLSTLEIYNNPLISPPPEVVEQGTAAVLAYLRNQAWYHTQRLIIGAAGGVGLFVLLVLGFRWKQRGGRKKKVVSHQF